MKDKTLDTWALNIRALTARSGLSQSELARRAGMTRDTFNRYHSGRTRPPTDKLEALAAVFSVHPNDIDPDRLTLVKRQPSKRPSPFEITPSGSGDPDLVHIKIDADVSTEAMTRILEIVSQELKRLGRDEG